MLKHTENSANEQGLRHAAPVVYSHLENVFRGGGRVNRLLRPKYQAKRSFRE
jgi:hypothetical protein